ncbi:MAG TPA: rRNA maturation RNase YbeY, partial [Candidatus Avimonas sp.]|nr:rRNA maturation RNase YbeY [Candidatus Avimonas sp.]
MEKLKVVIENKQKKVRIPTGIRLLIRRCYHATLELEGFQGSAEIGVTIVDDDQIRQLNNEYRNIDSSTDVLSFPMGKNGVFDKNPETGAYILGDVVL